MCLINEDGKNVVPPLDVTINVAAPPAGFLYKNQRIALAMNMVTFPKYGDYSISWLVEGQEVFSIPLKISLPPTPPSTT